MIKIIYEDPYILILEKPPGLVVDKSQTQKENTLEDWLSYRHSELVSESQNKILKQVQDDSLERGGIVHRLDKDTSGLLLIAKTQEALANLQAQFKAREVKKEYLALVHGMVEERGKVEGAIGRNPVSREKFTVLDSRPARSDAQDLAGQQGKEAVTEYEPEEKLKVKIEKLKVIFKDFNKIQLRKLERMEYGSFTLLRCYPRTGRTHQIRVHLKYMGHPVVSDEKYAGRKMYRLDHRWCPRQFLHAAKIGFRHPGSDEWVEFESPLPEDLEKALWIISLHNLQ